MRYFPKCPLCGGEFEFYGSENFKASLAFNNEGEVIVKRIKKALQMNPDGVVFCNVCNFSFDVICQSEEYNEEWVKNLLREEKQGELK